MYTAIETFYDRELKRTYKKGEEYPGEGYETDKNWVGKLLSGDNRVRRPVIERAAPAGESPGPKEILPVDEGREPEGIPEAVPEIPYEKRRKTNKAT